MGIVVPFDVAAQDVTMNNGENAEEAIQRIRTAIQEMGIAEGLLDDVTVNGTNLILVFNTSEGQKSVTIPIGDIFGAIRSINDIYSNGDGTVIIEMTNGDKYTINLNHTHENMCKLMVCTSNTVPAEKKRDTIYVQVDNANEPTEIQKLFIAGLEFVGGGGAPDTGLPTIISPSNGTNINLGYNDGSGVSQTINVRGKNLTGNLTITVSTGLSLTYGQSTGSSITIPKADALTGALVTIAFSGSGSIDDGSLVVLHEGNVLSEVHVACSADVRLKAVKLTGTQWMKTDWNLTANTDITMKIKLTANANSDNARSSENWYLISEPWPSDATNEFFAYVKHSQNNPNTCYDLLFQVKSNTVAKKEIPKETIQTDEAILSLSHSGVMTFTAGGTTYTVASASSIKAVNYPLNIGALTNEANLDTTNKPFSKFILTIYEITISENGINKRHYLPYRVNGVVGMLDDVTGHFMSSKTDYELEAEELTNNN